MGEVLQYTGQGSIDSLRTYIKLAYRRINRIPETVSVVQLLMLHQEFEAHLIGLLKQLDKGLPAEAFKAQVLDLIDAKNRDFSNAQKALRSK
ncbi:hypothetical protein D3C76_1181230 [compost metagenome]